ncbi:hypothetical protein [Rhodanobacter sp. L36]|uniref:hypothetical protein n=1 Tax=Rhodanobacter sp. L36 TaxID=1747221 RepID=UPI00131AA16D|nr:hypothetical protein [Rhodanobacter sp. L36]
MHDDAGASTLKLSKRLSPHPLQPSRRRIATYMRASLCSILPTRWMIFPPTLRPNDCVKVGLGVFGKKLYMELAASTVL